MKDLKVLNEVELSTVVGGGNRKVAHCAGLIGSKAAWGAIMGGYTGTAVGQAVGTLGGALFGESMGIIQGSAACISYLVSHK